MKSSLVARFALFYITLWLSTLAIPGPVEAATSSGEPILFKETGHTLAYNFRDFWEKNGGLRVLGFALTEVFIEQGRPVQYFERARLEWHGEVTQVMAGLLGRWATRDYRQNPAFQPVPDSHQPDQQYFAETQHTLIAGFQRFWRNNGGLAVFGFPLSEEFKEVNPQDGRAYTVQYFERARFEYHPELPEPYRVELGLLGRQYLEAVKPAPAAALAPVSSADKAWEGLRPSRLKIDRLNLDSEIVEGSFSLESWDVPRYTGVHYWPVSGYPGTPGNIVLAGHAGYRDIIFNNLTGAVVGDKITMIMGQTQRIYVVSSVWTVLPDATWVMAPTTDETLTLITCVPINVYDHRLIVRAVPVKN
jgi:LPXTG-site transpeptidase (sortase) family protein